MSIPAYRLPQLIELARILFLGAAGVVLLLGWVGLLGLAAEGSLGLGLFWSLGMAVLVFGCTAVVRAHRGDRPPGVDALGVLVFCSPAALAIPMMPALGGWLTVTALAAAISLAALRAVQRQDAFE